MATALLKNSKSTSASTKDVLSKMIARKIAENELFGDAIRRDTPCTDCVSVFEGPFTGDERFCIVDHDAESVTYSGMIGILAAPARYYGDELYFAAGFDIFAVESTGEIEYRYFRTNKDDKPIDPRAIGDRVTMAIYGES